MKIRTELYNKTEKKLYEDAIERYYDGDYKSASLEFGSILDYKDAETWDTLAKIRLKDWYVTVEPNIAPEWIKAHLDFADVKDLVFEFPNITGFFEGTWSDGVSFFTMTSDGSITYNLPRIAFDGAEGYKFDKNDLFLYKGTQERKVFNITILSDYAIDIFCYKDGSTHRLYRQ